MAREPLAREDQQVYTFDRVVRMVLSTVTLVALLFLLRYLSDVLIPFAAAVVLAYLLNPLVTIFERKTRHRGAAVAITLCGIGIVGMALLVLVVPLMVGQFRAFGRSLDELRTDLAASIEVEDGSAAVRPDRPSLDVPLESQAPGAAGVESAESEPKSALGWRELKTAWAAYRRNADDLPRAKRLQDLSGAVEGTYIGDIIDDAVEYTDTQQFRQLLVDVARRLAVGGWSVFTFTLNMILGLTGLIVVLLYLVFLLLDFPHYARQWPTFLPPSYRQTIVGFWELFEAALRRYFRGQAVVAMLTGLLFAIGFSLIGLPLAVPFGLFVGLLNMVPYLQIVALVPGLLLAVVRAIESDSGFLVSILLTLAVFGVVQVIQDGLIVPRIMGKATGLRPIAILLGVFVWGKLLGFLGLMLAIPLTCLGIAYYRRYVLSRTPAGAT